MPYNPADEITIRVEIDINGTRVDITTRGRGRSCTINQGRSPSATQAESARLSLEIGNDDGWLTEDNPESPWYGYWGRGCPIYVSIVGVLGSAAQRFAGQVDTIRLRWDAPDRCVAEVDAIGTLAVLAQNDEPLLSAMHRAVSALAPIAHWPCTDGADATLVSSAVPGVAAMQKSGSAVMASIDPPAGVADRLPDCSTGGVFAAGFGSSASNWRFEVLVKNFSGNIAFANVLTSAGPSGTFRLFAPSSTDDRFIAANDFVVLTYNYGFANYTDWTHVAVTCVAGTYQLWVNGAGSAASAGPVSSPTGVKIGKLAGTTSVPGSFGHVAFFADGSAPTTYAALDGYTGELDGQRIQRLCDEQGVATNTISLGSVPMGPQRPGQFVELLRECEDAGQGLLHDSGVDGAIGYLAAEDLYNQTATLVVTKGGISTLAPVWDGQYVVNDVTSSRPNGGSAHVSDEAHIARIRSRRTASPSVNVEDDGQLADDAGFRVRKGTTPGARYESVGINLRNVDGALLADAVLGHGIGERLTVAAAALPSQASPDGVDALTIGWTEQLDADQWIFQPNVVPYQPYNVFKVGDQILGRIAPDPFTVATAISATATSMVVKPVDPGVPLWITTASRPGDFPFSIDVAGEKQTVTAAASTVKDTFTRTASSGWGTSDTGQAWTTSGGTATDFSVGSGVGAIAFAAAGARKQTQIGPSYADVRVRVKISPTVVATGAQIDQGITLRRDSAGDSGYEILLRFDTDSMVYLRINKVVTSTATTLLTQPLGLAYSAGSSFWLLADIVGSQMRLKVWPTTGNEPQVGRSFSDTAVTAAGQVGACCRVQSGNTNVPVTPKWDDFELLSPQTFTVVRSVNGVIKEQAAGNPVGLWQPTALAL